MFRYAVVSQTKSIEGFSYEVPRIVLKDHYGMIAGYTEFDKYIVRKGKRIKGKSSTVEFAEAKYIVQLLNYIKDECRKSISDVTVNDLQSFLDWYAAGHGGNKCPGSEAVNNCCMYVSNFIAEMANAGETKYIKADDLLVHTKAYSNKLKKVIDRTAPKLQARSFAGVVDEKFKDLPGRSVIDLIEISSKHDPMLTIGICAGAWGGLRIGEIVNLETQQSSAGPGILIAKANGTIKTITMDITREGLRTKNNKYTGKIKRPRKQKILPEFNEQFNTVLESHMSMLNSVNSHNQDAMFLNKWGYAMSDETFRTRFGKLISEHFVPFLVESEDDEYQIAGQLILEHGISPHVLRHWFSTYLAIHTDDPHVIAHWRGDRDIESANTYLQNKGALEKQLNKTVALAQEKMFREGTNK